MTMLAAMIRAAPSCGPLDTASATPEANIAAISESRPVGRS